MNEHTPIEPAHAMHEPIAALWPDPLPQRYLTVQPGVGGVIKQRAEDFLVDEIPAYDPVGEGEHLYLGIEKSGVSHAEMIACIAKRLNVPRDKVSFAGMKDKHAITRQTISLHLHKDPPGIDLQHDRIRVLWARRHRNRLRRGHLKGNRFSIRIRGVDPTQAPIARSILLKLERTGVPNFFGPQRFGYRRNTHRLGLAILRREYDAIVHELLGVTGSPYPDVQQQRRELYEQGRFRDALQLWSVADRAESSLLHSLMKGATPREACARLDRSITSFWISALQSAVFNRVLDDRLQAGTISSLTQGDLAWKHDKGSVFRVTADELATCALPPRLDAQEISPSGPMWGHGMTRAEGEIDAAERNALASYGLSPDDLDVRHVALEGARRPLRVPIRLPSIDAGVDEHGGYIRVRFELPAGAYATIVTRELMKSEQPSDESD